MESIDIRRITMYFIVRILVGCLIVGIPIAVLSSAAVIACVDTVIRFNDYGICGWEALAIFAASLSVLLSISAFLLRRASKLDIALSVTITGIGACLFLEYVVGLAGFGNLAFLFTLALGYVLSGRERRKIPWKPRNQFVALFLIVALSISLYTLGPHYVPVSLSLFDESLKVHVPLMIRLFGEMCIVVALMHLGRGAMEHILAATRQSV